MKIIPIPKKEFKYHSTKSTKRSEAKPTPNMMTEALLALEKNKEELQSKN